ncbi:MAG: hypothetical protein JSR45_09010 [Proteobacteria bacterium]|nr:hypothetical protein [Pseudomonadota bacterium]
MMRMLMSLGALAATAAPAATDTSAALDLGPTLAEVRAYAARDGDTVWPGYGQAPLGFLLIEPEREVLLCQPGRVEGFTPDGSDAATGCARAIRPRSGMPDRLLAAMAIFGPPSTIVMGTPQSTGRSRASWTRTILHEHFHQFQDEQPGMYERQKALGLSDPSDRSGMWMLNYPFPYADAAVGDAYARASNALADAVEARGKPDFTAAFDRYLAARAAFQASVPERDWRYLEFELWKEGVARWTEVALGRRYPDPEVRKAADALDAAALKQLRKPDLAAQQRELVYAYGAAEAALIDSCKPDWRKAYFDQLALAPLLKSARAACGA